MFRNTTKEWYHIHVNGDEIVCTGGHPFYVVNAEAGRNKVDYEGRPENAKGAWICANELQIGDKLLLANGIAITITAIQVEGLSMPETTYNFEVADSHTYYVSNSKVLVHNNCSVKTTNKAKVHGKAHGSAEHQTRIMQEVEAMQASGKYSDIYLNKALKTVGLNGSQRPDIIGKLIDGSFDALEVAGKTQMSTSLAGQQLISKVALMQANNPGLYIKPIIWLFG